MKFSLGDFFGQNRQKRRRFFVNPAKKRCNAEKDIDKIPLRVLFWFHGKRETIHAENRSIQKPPKPRATQGRSKTRGGNNPKAPPAKPTQGNAPCTQP